MFKDFTPDCPKKKLVLCYNNNNKNKIIKNTKHSSNITNERTKTTKYQNRKNINYNTIDFYSTQVTSLNNDLGNNINSNSLSNKLKKYNVPIKKSNRKIKINSLITNNIKSKQINTRKKCLENDSKKNTLKGKSKNISLIFNNLILSETPSLKNEKRNCGKIRTCTNSFNLIEISNNNNLFNTKINITEAEDSKKQNLVVMNFKNIYQISRNSVNLKGNRLIDNDELIYDRNKVDKPSKISLKNNK